MRDPASEETTHTIKRARALLGTYVAIHVRGTDEATALAAIERGFAAVADIHRLMSFHEPDSDLSRMNRGAVDMPVVVDERTFSVLRAAIEIAERSRETFDVTVGAELVARGLLPRPETRQPVAEARWRDVELIPPDRVRYRRPLWVDLGGIAKGYAVDQAIAAMNLPLSVQCMVNAGGDLRVAGPEAERALLRAPPGDGGAVPVVEIENGSLASSGSGHMVGGAPHLDGSSRRSIDAGRFVSVAAEPCMIADALTKVVLAEGAAAEPVLKAYGAVAYLHDAAAGWQTVGA